MVGFLRKGREGLRVLSSPLRSQDYSVLAEGDDRLQVVVFNFTPSFPISQV